MSNSLKVQSLALCLPLTLLLACGQNDSKKKNEAPLVQKDAPAEPAPAPAPVEPTVVEPAPVVPAPLPAPLEPTVVEPAPVVPAPVEPTPVTPAPVEPEPAKPAPVEPAPAKPAPVEPTPAKPTPVEPAPVKPAPVEPTPAKPAPVKPVQQPEIVGTWAACDIYDYSSLSFKASGSAYFVGTFGADGTYKAQQVWFTDAECKVPFTQDAADRMKADGAQFEEQELQDYLKGTSFESSYKAEAIGANGLGTDDANKDLYKIVDGILSYSVNGSDFAPLGSRK